MTLTHPTVSAAQHRPRPARATARTYQNQVLAGLLHRCTEHDEAALQRLYELTSPWIYALVTRRTSSVSVADNAMVAIYTKVWRQAARHGEHDHSILAWMTIIAYDETRRLQASTDADVVRHPDDESA
jgi:DNA-directed RNA polymerase specialized sigma24 family protein